MPSPILHIAFTLVGDVACVLAKDNDGQIVRRHVCTVQGTDDGDAAWRAMYQAFLLAAQEKPRSVVFYSDLAVVVTELQRNRTGVRGIRKSEPHWVHVKTVRLGLDTYWPGSPQGTWKAQLVEADKLQATRGLAVKVEAEA